MIIQIHFVLQKKEITYITENLKPNLCVYNDAYILVTGNIAVVAAFAAQEAFKNCALFTRCIPKIDGTSIDDADYLDLVMPMHN